jgi:CO/xanthine dehydrogenase FAD-binding subunit
MALAGGTNLIVELMAGRVTPKTVLAIDRIGVLRGIAADEERVTIGALTTVAELLEHDVMGRWAPSLVEAARVFAGQMVRNTATVAGNICCGSPAADLVPPLLSLDAELTLNSRSGNRKVALADFFTGYKTNLRRSDELVTAIAWPRLDGSAANLFYKLARRKGDAITVVGVAVTLAVNNGRCSHARIALGAVAPICKRAKVAEAMLEGERLTSGLIAAATDQAVREASPIDDIRGSAEYRRHAVGMLVRRLLTQAAQRVGQEGA